MMSMKWETNVNKIDISWYHEINLVTPEQHSSKPFGFEELIILEVLTK
jgi:hypothetical protein